MQETPTSSLTTFLAERNLLYIQQYSILSIHLTELFKVLHGIVVEALFKVTILELVREVGVAGLPMILLLLLVEGGGEGGVALGLGQGVQRFLEDLSWPGQFLDINKLAFCDK